MPQCHSLETTRPSPHMLGVAETKFLLFTIVWGCGLALYWEYEQNQTHSSPNQHTIAKLVKCYKHGYRTHTDIWNNTCLGMRGSTAVQTGYSHLLLLENTNGYLISARPHSICEFSLYPCGSEVCTAGKLGKKKKPLQEAFWKFGKLWTVLKTKY